MTDLSAAVTELAEAAGRAAAEAVLAAHPVEPQSPLLSIDETAAFLRVSRDKVRSMLRNGELTTVRMHGLDHPRIARAELQDQIDAQIRPFGVVA